MENNIVLDTMGKVMEARFKNDKAELDALLEDNGTVHVSLADVVFALDVILDDIANLADYDLELMEHRMIAIVESLDEVTQARIKAKFNEAEDYLFSHHEDQKGEK